PFLCLPTALHPPSPLFPYTTLFRSVRALSEATGLDGSEVPPSLCRGVVALSLRFTRESHARATDYLADDGLRLAYLAYYLPVNLDRKSTRLNSSHVSISYAVFCLKK